MEHITQSYVPLMVFWFLSYFPHLSIFLYGNFVLTHLCQRPAERQLKVLYILIVQHQSLPVLLPRIIKSVMLRCDAWRMTKVLRCWFQMPPESASRLIGSDPAIVREHCLPTSVGGHWRSRTRARMRWTRMGPCFGDRKQTRGRRAPLCMQMKRTRTRRV